MEKGSSSKDRSKLVPSIRQRNYRQREDSDSDDDSDSPDLTLNRNDLEEPSGDTVWSVESTPSGTDTETVEQQPEPGKLSFNSILLEFLLMALQLLVQMIQLSGKQTGKEMRKTSPLYSLNQSQVINGLSSRNSIKSLYLISCTLNDLTNYITEL